LIGVIDHFGKGLLLLVVVPILVWTAWTLLRIMTMIRHLRLRTISPALLQQKIDDGERVGVIDLLRYEAFGQELAGIPGAVRTDPTQLRSGQRVTVPDGVTVVLYCSSKNELTTARVAEAMKRVGVTNVWILEGGLDAWIAEGRPTTTEFSTKEELALKLGIVLPPAPLRRRHGAAA
jgi:3-mercaptopyruvate sulfurtransferase SseA